MTAVAGSEVDRHAGVAACEALGLADVQLEEVATADNSKHASILEGDAARIW
jgi:3-methyladenine DNA glycosylase AlkD